MVKDNAGHYINLFAECPVLLWALQAFTAYQNLLLHNYLCSKDLPFCDSYDQLLILYMNIP